MRICKECQQELPALDQCVGCLLRSARDELVSIQASLLRLEKMSTALRVIAEHDPQDDNVAAVMQRIAREACGDG